jgi:hypothetical protein
VIVHSGCPGRAASLLPERKTRELAGFLDGADLPPELELDVAANLAAADGLLVRAIQAIEAAGPF